jgi:hypothetical protein
VSGSGKKKSRIPVRATGTNSGTPGGGGSAKSSASSSQGKMKRSISADRMSSARRDAADHKSAKPTTTDTAGLRSDRFQPSTRSHTERGTSKSLLRVSNASSTSLPPALTAQETAQVLQNIHRNISGNKATVEHDHVPRSEYQCEVEAVGKNTTTSLIRNYPRPPPSMDLTLSDTSFSLSHFHSTSLNSTAMGVGNVGKNISSEWGCNMSALSPIGRVDSDVQGNSASYTTIEQDRSVPTGMPWLTASHVNSQFDFQHVICVQCNHDVPFCFVFEYELTLTCWMGVLMCFRCEDFPSWHGPQ